MSARLARCDPRLLDFVTWTVLKGCRLFQRVHITPLGLVATSTIPAYDFVAVVPTSTTLSLLNLAEDASFPLKVSPQNHGEELAFWPDLTYGSFAFIGYLTKVLRSGSPRGERSYLDVLPFDPGMAIGSVADAAQKTKDYSEMIEPLKRVCKSQDVEFNLAFRHAYCLFRRHAIPFWSNTEAGGAGHPDFQHSPFAEIGHGDILGMVPLLDLALHSPEPNASIGYPDADMLQWLAQEKKAGIQVDKGYFVMQAQRDIHRGEVITVNKNAYFNFDDATFTAWFGYPNVSQHHQSAEGVKAPAESYDNILEAGSPELSGM
ncbi:hypothetical protein TraAM80_08213 [Trypanosoma rangeli]|uniref:SET domain-containing protein n=1 Tax=Trypanosoma rangeli TaxID=5698 RepID=A0A3R7KQI7_TRYRA|nr:uncharacterized protein TraAM80_08213 [Trypanosoma rangeli]RNE99392.1 hypothetical protein TraAM80_08213 [Trypanosoma rangeli]|eukprot:RNE99392.1 hypothetical protein TraAM80_08213 [Trypanosoma rangeli]